MQQLLIKHAFNSFSNYILLEENAEEMPWERSKVVKQDWVIYGIPCTFDCNIYIPFRGSNMF